jgi:hypothetical protein
MIVPVDEEPGDEFGRPQDLLERHHNREAGIRRPGQLEYWKAISP